MGNSSSSHAQHVNVDGEEREFYIGGSPYVRTLCDNNRKWVQSKLEENPSFFEKTSQVQKPKYFWVGCSDSRVTAESITGCEPGEMFIHRNIANLVVNSDINFLSVLQFAVEKIHVKDIIVCGHYGCGGVQAAMSNKDYGLLDNWLRNIRDVSRLHNDELRAVEDTKNRFKRLVELNVVEQCINILKNGIVQRRQAKCGYPRVHAVVYDMEKGLLRELNINFKQYIDNYEDIYRLYPFQTAGHSSIRARTIADACNGSHDERGRISISSLREKLETHKDIISSEDLENAIGNAFQRSDGLISIDQVIAYFTDHMIDEEESEVSATNNDSKQLPSNNNEQQPDERLNDQWDTSPTAKCDEL